MCPGTISVRKFVYYCFSFIDRTQTASRSDHSHGLRPGLLLSYRNRVDSATSSRAEDDVGQEAALAGKLLAPCRIENKACGAGAIPGRQALRTLPD